MLQTLLPLLLRPGTTAASTASTKNEEELVYQASSRGKMKKNCSTRPSLNQRGRRIGLQEKPLVAQSQKTKSHTIIVLYGRRFSSGLNLDKTVMELVCSLFRPKMKKNCFTKPPLKGK